MDEYLDKQKVIDELTDWHWGLDASLVEQAIENIPIADAERVVHSKWVGELVTKPDWRGKMATYYQPWSCPVCHHPDLAKGESKYCANCGAKMDLEE